MDKDEIDALAARDEQQRAWNGPSGEAWVDEQALLDRLFEPFAERLVEEAQAVSARRVLDIGCGTGATTLSLARALGPDGECTGIDISAPMISLARQRAAAERQAAERLSVGFEVADAETFAFPFSAVDLVVSRFGVMFFGDPVRAFANLGEAVREGGRLAVFVWRDRADNPFMTAAERAAAPLLPPQPARDPHAPGQFAFADREHVAAILAEAGWGRPSFEPVDIACTLSVEELERYMIRLGPLARSLPSLDPAARDRVIAAVRAGFEPFRDGEVIRFTAACWLIRAAFFAGSRLQARQVGGIG
jgi:SAM-dependent methyltransferase